MEPITWKHTPSTHDLYCWCFKKSGDYHHNLDGTILNPIKNWEIFSISTLAHYNFQNPQFHSYPRCFLMSNRSLNWTVGTGGRACLWLHRSRRKKGSLWDIRVPADGTAGFPTERKHMGPKKKKTHDVWLEFGVWEFVSALEKLIRNLRQYHGDETHLQVPGNLAII